ncbi:MAG: glycosyltransferase [Phycisphaera sp.]|nr:glycosyltransferase [Phycisphaera sp.]
MVRWWGVTTCLVIPCYNEAGRLDTGAIAAFLVTQGETSVIFVNDGSTDSSQRLLEQFCTQHAGRARVIDIQPNVGKAEAVRRGLLDAMKNEAVKYVGFLDADLATPIGDMPLLVREFERGETVQWVFGSRVRLMGRDVHRKTGRHYIGRVFATFASLTLGLPIYDTQCGAKVFRNNKLLADVIAEPFETRWLFEIEMVARLARLHRKGVEPDPMACLVEYPLPRWRDVAGSKVKPMDFVRALLQLWTIRRKYR